MLERIRYLKGRLAAHKRRMRFWANLPSFTGFGPSRRRLHEADEKYELACDDAASVAKELSELTGKEVRVLDVKKTFQNKWMNPKGVEVYL